MKKYCISWKDEEGYHSVYRQTKKSAINVANHNWKREPKIQNTITHHIASTQEEADSKYID